MTFIAYMGVVLLLLQLLLQLLLLLLLPLLHSYTTPNSPLPNTLPLSKIHFPATHTDAEVAVVAAEVEAETEVAAAETEVGVGNIGGGL